MGLKTFLTSLTTDRTAEVDEAHAARICVYPPDLPKRGAKSRYRYLQGVLGSTGLSSGTVNMNVDGTTPQTFFMAADDDYDAFIMGIGIIIADSAVDHNSFGNLTISNGWDLQIVEAGQTTKLIDAAVSGGEVIFQSGMGRPYGDAATSWEMTNWQSSVDATTCYMSVGDYVPGGIRIGRGTEDQLQSVVNDDLQGLVEFTVRVYGYKHFPVGG